ncbi:MAG: DUF1778 domain-containing protein [Tatlockia sp.]|nr:DUF1778 domain-containing protein [Tatlockia sp.]
MRANKQSPINLRALPAQKELIDRAASLLHKNRSDFMLDAACKEAENVLLSQRLFFANEEAYALFLSLLDSPIEENLALNTLLKSTSPWEK